MDWNEYKNVAFWYQRWPFWLIATAFALWNLIQVFIGAKGSLIQGVIVVALLPGLLWFMHRLETPEENRWRGKHRFSDDWDD